MSAAGLCGSCGPSVACSSLLPVEPQNLATAFFRRSCNTLASGSTTTCAGSNGQVITTFFESPLTQHDRRAGFLVIGRRPTHPW